MGSVTAQADQHGRRGADDTALGGLSGQPPRRSRPLKPNCCHRFAVSVGRRYIVWRCDELRVDVLRANSRRFEMNALLMVYFSVGASFAGLGLLKLQARLEQWAYRRHAED
jgi:hypothetical protein